MLLESTHEEETAGTESYIQEISSLLSPVRNLITIKPDIFYALSFINVKDAIVFYIKENMEIMSLPK